MQGNDYVKAVKEIEGGYEITFSKGTVATIKNGKDGINGETPVLTAAKDGDQFYWKVNGTWLEENGEKVPASRTPVFTAGDFKGKTYWKIDGKWLMNGEDKVRTSEDATPVKFDAVVSDDKSTIIFTFDNGDETTSKYVVNIAKGELTITGKNTFIVGEATTYKVDIPGDWAKGDLDVVRADVASTGATGVAITRSGVPAAWEVAAVKVEGGATITVTGTNIMAGDVAELTVTFVKKNGERLVGSTFLTAWVKETTAQPITADGTGNVAATIAAYPATHTIYTAITVDGNTEMTTADWEALKTYSSLEDLTISNNATGAKMPANAFENHPALKSVVLTSSTFAVIPASAFAGCLKLASFTGTTDITEIGASAFEGCTELATLAPVSGVIKVGKSAFKGCALLGSATAFGTLETLGANAFNGCTAWTTVPTLNASLTELPEGVFTECGFSDVSSMSTVETIGKDAFKGCASLETISFDAATVIHEGAFANTGLTSITFGAALTTAEATAFEDVAYEDCEVTLKTTSAGEPDSDSSLWLGQTWKSVTLN